MELHQARPPFVEFKRVAVHDKRRSEELGRRVTKDVDYAFVMQPGSKDQVERVATDWLNMLKTKALNGSADAYPQAWIDMFHSKYEAWKNGQELPLDGTSVKEWPLLSPSQAENFISLRVLTIEDVASMTEDALRAYGLGARELRDHARDWIKGKSKAETENEVLRKQIAELTDRLNAMEKIEDNTSEPQQVKRGRKPKVIESVE